MTTIATAAMWQFAVDWERAIDSAARREDAATISGIVGDLAHRLEGGYHISREDQPASNYSCQLAEDRQGGSTWASAVDMNMRPAEMVLVTKRLLASAKDQTDLRLNVCREFYGTLDGRTVVGWDTFYGTPATSNDTHLWHVHISFLRKFANDPAAMAAVLSVITGQPSTPSKGAEMNLTDKITGTKTPQHVDERDVNEILGDEARDRAVDYGERPITDLPVGSPKRRLYELLPALERLVAAPAGVDISALVEALRPALAGVVADELSRRLAE